jgi:hypothetical protein
MTNIRSIESEHAGEASRNGGLIFNKVEAWARASGLLLLEA